jgi:hypothetical protein
VMVTSVPYQLASSAVAEARAERAESTPSYGRRSRP